MSKKKSVSVIERLTAIQEQLWPIADELEDLGLWNEYTQGIYNRADWEDGLTYLSELAEKLGGCE